MTQDNRTLTFTLQGKAEGQQQINALRDAFVGVQGVLRQLKKEAEGVNILSSVGSGAREQVRVVQAAAESAVALAQRQNSEARALKVAQDALTASLRAQSNQASITSRLSIEGQNRYTLAITETIREIQRQNAAVKGMSAPARFNVKFDEAGLNAQFDRFRSKAGQQMNLKVRLDVTQAKTDFDALVNHFGKGTTVKIKLAGLDTAENDFKKLKTLIDSIGSNMQYRITVNTTTLTAVNTQIQTQIVSLQSLISQLRSLGGAGGGGGGGSAGTGSLSANAKQLLAELERLNNQWKRGEISATNMSLALQALQPKMNAAAQAAGVGTREFAVMDRGITTIVRSLRTINTDALGRIRTDAAAARLAFEQATAGITRGSSQYQTAMATYQAANTRFVASLEALRTSGNLTTQQMGAVVREMQRLARESNTIAGNVNHAGLSGSMVNALGAGAPLLTQSGGALGMMVANGAALGVTLKNLAQNAGPTALALGGVGIAAAGVAVGMINLGRVGLDETKKLQTGLNILQANGVSDLEAMGKSIDSLQDKLGKVGQSVTRGDLMLATADIVKAGLSSEQAMTLLTSSTRLAAAEQINLNDASTLLLKNVRQYNMDVSEAARVGDMLAKAGNLAAGTANDLSTGLGIVGGTGMQAKIEMHDLLGMLVELDNKGMSAADVGANGLRAAIAALADVTKKGTGILKGLGIEINGVDGKARPAGDILVDLGAKMRGMGIHVDKATGTLSGNGEALRTVASIMDNRAAAAVINLTGEWRGYGQQVKDSKDELINYSNTMQQGAIPALARLSNAWKDAGGAFAKSFAGPLADFLDHTLTPMITKFGDLLEKMRGVKDNSELKATLKIDWAKDDATTMAYKLIMGTGQVVKGVADGVNNNTNASQSQWDDLVKKFNISQLQGELVRQGLLQRQWNPAAQLAQAKEIQANEAHYRALLVEKLQKNTEALTGNTKTIQPLKPNEAGALLPGQRRDLGTGFASSDTVQRMNPAFQQQILGLMGEYAAKNANGLTPFIFEGFRTMERQAELYKIGRDANGKKIGQTVTNALPGQSIHQYGVAADIYWRDRVTDKVVSFNDPRALEAARALGKLATSKGLVWGGTPGWGGPVDMPHIQEDISWRQAAKKYGSPGTPPIMPTPTTRGWADYEKEARRIIGNIKKYASDGTAPNGEKWAAANKALETFSKTSATAASAVAWVQSETKKADKEVSKYGQTFDSLKAKLDVAQSLENLGQSVVPQLQSIKKAALDAANAEKSRNGETAKYRALLDLAGDAAKRLEATQKTQDKMTKDAALTWDQWTKNRTKALDLAKREQQLADGKLTPQQAIQLRSDLAAYRKDPVQAAALEEAQRQLAEQDKVGKERESREKSRAAALADIQKGMQQRNVETARAGLEELKRLQAEQLSEEGKTAAQREQIVNSTGPAILKATYALNAEIKRQKDAETLAWSTSEAAKALTAAEVADEVKRRNTESRSVERAANLQAQREQEAARKTAETKRLEEEKRLAAELAGLKIEQARSTSARLKTIEDADLKAHEGNLQKQLELTEKYARAQYDRAVAIAVAERDKRKGAATGPNAGAERAAADAAYSEAEATAAVTRDQAIGGSNDRLLQGIRTTRTAYSELAKTIRDKTKAGTFDDQAQTDAVASFNRIGKGATDAGIALNTFVAGARTTVENLIEVGRASQRQVDAQEAFNQAVTDSFKAQSDLADDWLSRVQQALDDKDVTGAFLLVSEGMDAVAESAGEMPVSAEAVGKLIAKLDALNDQFDKSSVEDMKAWLAQWQEIKDTVDKAATDWAQGNADAKTQQGQDDQIAEMKGRGARALIDYFLPDPAEYVRFGDRFAFDLTEASQKALMEAVGSLGEDELAALGEEKLQAVLDGIANDPNPELFESLKTKVASALVVATRTRIGDDLMADMNGVADEFDALKLKFADVVDPAGLQEFQAAADALAVKAEAIANAGKDLSNGSDLQTWATALRADVEMIGRSLEDVMEALNNGDPNILDDYIQSIFDTGEAAKEAFANGTIGATEFNDILTAQVEKYDDLYQRLLAMGPARAAEAEQVRLLMEYFKGAAIDADKLSAAMLKLNLSQARKGRDQRLMQFQTGEISATELGKSTADDINHWSKVAINLEKIGKTEAAKEVREFVQSLKDGLPTIGKAALATSQLAAAKGQINDARSGIGNLVGGGWREFDQGWAEQVSAMQDAKKQYPEIADQIDRIISKGKVFKALNLFQDVAKSMNEWAQVGQKIASAVGEDETAQALGDIANGLAAAGQATMDWTRVAAGDMTALPSAIMNTVEALDGLLNGIQALDPAYKAWQKNQREIIKLEQEGMGQKKYNNWLENPYYDTLQADAAARDKLTNAKPLQSLWWWLSDTTPKVLDDATAKATAKAGAIFNQFGQDLASSLENELMNAIDSGNWDDVEKNVSKVIDRFINQTIVAAVLAKSNLGPLLKQYSEEMANGLDTTNTVTLIRQEVGAVTDTLKNSTDILKTTAKSIFEGLGNDLSSGIEDAMLTAWDSGDWDKAEKSMTDKINRFVAQMALKALMATSNMKKLVDKYVADYEAGLDTSEALAAIRAEVGRINTAWTGIATGLPGYASNPDKSNTLSKSDTRQRNETLYQYEHETDPQEKEKLRQKLLGFDKSGSSSGPSVAVVTREAAGPDWVSFQKTLDRHSDRLLIFEKAMDVFVRGAEKVDSGGDKIAQAAGMILLAAQGGSKGGGGPGNLNF